MLAVEREMLFDHHRTASNRGNRDRIAFAVIGEADRQFERPRQHIHRLQVDFVGDRRIVRRAVQERHVLPQDSLPSGLANAARNAARPGSCRRYIRTRAHRGTPRSRPWSPCRSTRSPRCCGAPSRAVSARLSCRPSRLSAVSCQARRSKSPGSTHRTVSTGIRRLACHNARSVADAPHRPAPAP